MHGGSVVQGVMDHAEYTPKPYLTSSSGSGLVVYIGVVPQGVEVELSDKNWISIEANNCMGTLQDILQKIKTNLEAYENSQYPFLEGGRPLT